MRNLVTIAFALSLVACGKSENKNEALESEPRKEPAKEEPKKPDPPKNVEPPPVKIDPEIAKLVKNIVASCEVIEDKVRVQSCKNSEDWAIKEYAKKEKVTGVYESLGELALTEGAKDKKVFAAIVATWQHLGDRELETKAATPAAAERVPRLYALVPSTVLLFGNAASIPLIAGRRAELVAAMNKLEQGSPLWSSSVQSFLDWGGIEALPDLQQMYKNAKDDPTRQSIAWSVQFAVDNPKLAAGDRAKMCDWVKSVATETPGWAGALESLVKCKGTYIDDGLTAAEAHLKADKFTGQIASAVKSLCWAGDPAQCEKALVLLEKGLAKDDPSYQKMLVSFLVSVAKSGKIQPKARPILTKLSTSKDKELADAARAGLKEL